MDSLQDINDLLNQLDSKISNSPHLFEEIDQILKLIQPKVNAIEYEDYTLYGYYQYLIAEKCSSLSQLNEQQRIRYKRLKENHYDDYCNQLLKSANGMISEEVKQQIQYQISLYERQQQQGVDKLFLIPKVLKGAITLAQQKPAQEVGRALIKAFSPIIAVTTNQNVIEGALQATKACVSSFNIIFSLGIAAGEVIYKLWKYKKQLKKCTNENQRKEAAQHLLQELKALGSRTISSFTLTSSFTVAGATLGSLLPVVGSVIGGVVGAIVGSIANYFLVDYVIDPFFLKKIDFIGEYEREIGLESFEKENGRLYTKEEFDEKIKRCLLNEHPDKFKAEPLKKNARAKIVKIQISQGMIYRKMGWKTKED